MECYKMNMKNKLSFLAIAVAGALLTGCGQEKSESTNSNVEEKSVVDQKTEQVIVEPENKNVVEVTSTEKVVEEVVQVSEESKFVPVEGTHYEVLKSTLDVTLDDGMVISEFFWLGCPHCQRFEPAVHAWKNQIVESGVNVTIDKNAVPGNDRWNFDSAVYYTMKSLHATDEQVSQMLALYEKEAKVNKAYPSMEKIEEFFGEIGLDSKEAMAALQNTEMLNPMLAKSNEEYNKTESSGVPVFVINGKYKLLFNGMTSDDDVVNTMKYLNEMQ